MRNPLTGLSLLVAQLGQSLTPTHRPYRHDRPNLRRRQPRLQLEYLEGRDLMSVTGAGVLALASTTNTARLAPDYTHLNGGGASENVYDGSLGAVQVTALRGMPGALVEFTETNSNKIFYTPDATHFGGGGGTVQVYDGSQGNLSITRLYGGGVIAQTDGAHGNKAFYSPDAKNLVGGGLTQQVYDGAKGQATINPLKDGGCLIQFSDGSVFLSTDYKNLGVATGNTTRVYDGTQGAVNLVRTSGEGVLVQFTSGINLNRVFYSPDFKNLAGGGNTVQVYDGSQGHVTLTALQADKGVLTRVDLTNRVFRSTNYKSIAVAGGSTTQVYDGTQGALTLFATIGGGVLAQTDAAHGNKVFFSADATNLTAAANQVYDGSLGAVQLSRLEGGGVLTRVISSNAVFLSPDFKNLVSGGSTQQVYNGAAGQLSFVSLIKLGTDTTPVVSKPSGLQVVDEDAGGGTAVVTGNVVRVNYTGWLDDGTQFDTSVGAGKQPLVFKVGVGQVIAGWDEGLVGMQVGGTRKLIIPANLAYGTNPPAGIPVNARLTFEIDLLAINPAETLSAGADSLSSVAEDSAARTIAFSTLLGNDSVGPGNVLANLNITAVSNPVGGTVALSGNTVVFTPAANFNGVASFDYTVQDTSGIANPTTATGHVTFTITEANDAPAATDDTLSDSAQGANVRTISFASLTGNDSTGPANESGQTLTITSVSNPVGGTATIVGTDVVFTQDPAFTGLASFDYTVQDNGTTNGAADAKTDVGHVSFNVVA